MTNPMLSPDQKAQLDQLEQKVKSLRTFLESIDSGSPAVMEADENLTLCFLAARGHILRST